jgi:hypothetical protein
MPSNQFLSVQSLRVGKFGDSEIAQALRHFGRVAGGLLLLASAGRYRACGCGLHACDSLQFALHGVLRAACMTVPQQRAVGRFRQVKTRLGIVMRGAARHVAAVGEPSRLAQVRYNIVQRESARGVSARHASLTPFCLTSCSSF